MKGDRENCLAAGMDEYLCKPIRIKDVDDMLARLFASRVTASPTDASPRGKIDWEVALANVGGDQELLNELVTVFLDETPVLLKAAIEAASASDTKGLSAATHSLRGSMLFLDPKDAVALADRLENLSQAGDINASRECLSSLQAQYSTVCEELEQYQRNASC